MGKGLLLLGIFLGGLTPAAWAFDLELGVQRTKPQIGYHVQTYKSANSSLTFKPNGEETIFGQSMILGVGIGDYLVEMEQAEYKTTTIYTDGTGTDNLLSPHFTEKRLGLMYRAERELAGFFLGLGVEDYQESFVFQGETYANQGKAPYAKAGLALIFGPLRIRAEQLFSSIGEHNLKTNSLGLLVHF